MTSSTIRSKYLFTLGLCRCTSHLGKPPHPSGNKLKHLKYIFYAFCTLRDFYVPASWDKSMKNFSYLSELFKPLESAQGVRYQRRGAVLPAPSQLRITSWAGTHVTSHRMQQCPFMWASSAPGATALLIRQNKGNFLHAWLPPTCLGREKKGKKKRKIWRKTCELTPLIFPGLCLLHRCRSAQKKPWYF